MSQANRRKSSDEGPSTARVEAIFLSPDPEDGVSGGSSKQQELWRQDQENNASAASGGPNRQRSEKSTSTGSAKTTKSSAASSKASGRGSKGKAATADPLSPVSTKRDRRPQQQSSSTDDRMTSPGSATGGSAADSYRNRLRKTRSAMDMVAGVNRWKARPSFTSDAIVPLYASRRSSGASITVSLTCPDSPVPRLIFDGSKESPRPSDATPRRFGNNLRLEDVLSVQFVKIHQAATTVHSATRLSRPLRRLVARSQEKQSPRRRGSTPFVPRLNLKNSPSNADSPGWRSYPDRLDDDSELGPAVVTRRASSPSEMNTPRGFFLPASRPSSTLSQHETQQQQQPNKGGYVSRKSSITSLQLANVSRPWTPAPTPPTGTRLSPVKNPYRARSPGLISNPLQSINKQVKIILGCASTILEMYNRRVETDARKSPVKSYKKEPFKPIVLNDSKRRAAADKQLQPPTVAVDPKARRSAKSIVNNVLGPGWKNKKSAPTTPPSRFRSETKATASRLVNTNTNNNVKRSDPRESHRETTRSSGRKTNRAKSTDKTPTKEAISTARSEGKSSVKSGGQQQTPQHADTKRKRSMPAPPPSLVTFMKSSKSSSSSNKNKTVNGGIPEGVSGCVGGIAGFNNWPKREQYTDKDRAAAVILGDTDIKTTLEKQLKSDRGRYVLPKESPAQVYLAQAEFEMRIGGWTIAHQLLQKVHAPNIFGHPHAIRQLVRIPATKPSLRHLAST